MRIRHSSLIGPFFAVLLSFVFAFGVIAQDKKKGAENIQGTVTAIKKDTSTISVETTSNAPGGATAVRQVTYNASTKFLSGHSDDSKPGSLDKVQVGNFISCSGAMAKGLLMATDCVYREKVLGK